MCAGLDDGQDLDTDEAGGVERVSGGANGVRIG